MNHITANVQRLNLLKMLRILFFFFFSPSFFKRQNGPATAAPVQEGHFWKRSETKKRILRVAQETQMKAALRETQNFATMNWKNSATIRSFIPQDIKFLENLSNPAIRILWSSVGEIACKLWQTLRAKIKKISDEIRHIGNVDTILILKARQNSEFRSPHSSASNILRVAKIQVTPSRT